MRGLVRGGEAEGQLPQDSGGDFTPTKWGGFHVLPEFPLNSFCSTSSWLPGIYLWPADLCCTCAFMKYGQPQDAFLPSQVEMSPLERQNVRRGPPMRSLTFAHLEWISGRSSRQVASDRTDSRAGWKTVRKPRRGCSVWGLGRGAG